MSGAARGTWRGPYSAEVVRATLRGHSTLGIAFGAIIYLLCLTGSLLVFENELQRWEQPDAPRLARADDRVVAHAIGQAVARFGADARLYVTLPDETLPRLSVMHITGRDETSWIADSAGNLAVPQTAPWTDFLTQLHTQLHLPESWGRFIVGLGGVTLLSSILSGVLSHPRIVRDAFQLRLGGSRRLEQADIHNRIGVWALPFHLVVPLTGALLGLSPVIVGTLALLMFHGDSRKVFALLTPPAPVADMRPAPVPDIAAMLAVVRARSPEAAPLSLSLQNPGRRDAQVVISAGRPRLIAAQDSYTFDGTGRLLAESHPGSRTLGANILSSLKPLHYGTFGGLLVRIGYGVLGLGLCTLTSSGICVWLARRRDRGRPAPLWERVWASIVWGQPALLALTALVALLAPASPEGALGVIWLAGTCGLIAAAALIPALPDVQIRRLLRACLGVLLTAIALTYGVHWRMTGDAAAIWVDGVLLVIAGCLVLSSTGGVLLQRRAA